MDYTLTRLPPSDVSTRGPHPLRPAGLSLAVPEAGFPEAALYVLKQREEFFGRRAYFHQFFLAYGEDNAPLQTSVARLGANVRWGPLFPVGRPGPWRVVPAVRAELQVALQQEYFASRFGSCAEQLLPALLELTHAAARHAGFVLSGVFQDGQWVLAVSSEEKGLLWPLAAFHTSGADFRVAKYGRRDGFRDRSTATQHLLEFIAGKDGSIVGAPLRGRLLVVRPAPLFERLRAERALLGIPTDW